MAYLQEVSEQKGDYSSEANRQALVLLLGWGFLEAPGCSSTSDHWQSTLALEPFLKTCQQAKLLGIDYSMII